MPFIYEHDIRVPLRQHARAVRAADAGRSGEAAVGAATRSTGARTGSTTHLPGPREVDVPQARRGVQARSRSGLHLQGPARAVRGDDQAPPPPAGAAPAAASDVDGDEREPQRYTYGELQRASATRGAASCASSASAPGDRVMLMSREPARVGHHVLRRSCSRARGGAGRSAARRGRGREPRARVARAALVLSRKVVERLAGERPRGRRARSTEAVWSRRTVLELARAGSMAARRASTGSTGRRCVRPAEGGRRSRRSSSPPARPGTPKGVMLSHRNFTSLVSQAGGAVRHRQARRAAVGAAAAPHVRVLRRPPHAAHARRADHLPRRARRRRAGATRSRTGSVTGMVGVPALWQLLDRKIYKNGQRRAAVLVEHVVRCARSRSTARCATSCRGSTLALNRASCCSGRCTASSAAGMRLLISRRLGAAGRDDEGVPRPRLQPLRGLRPDRGVAGAHGRRGRATRLMPGHGRRAAAGHRRQDRQPRRERRRRGDRDGPERDGSATSRTPRRPRDVSQDGWLHTGDLGRFDDEGQPVHRRAQEGDDPRRRRRERLSRRARGALPRLAVHQGAVDRRAARRTAAARRSPA